MSPGIAGMGRCASCDLPGNGICSACRGRGKSMSGPCTRCSGTGRCARCNGTGRQNKSARPSFYSLSRKLMRLFSSVFNRNQCQECDEPGNGNCPTCHGLGHTLTQQCVNCSSTGKCTACDGTGKRS